MSPLFAVVLCLAQEGVVDELGSGGDAGLVDEVVVDGGLAEVDAGFDAGSWETRVVGTREVDVRRVAGSAQVVGREELERQEANDIHKVLQAVPGVYAREEDGFGLRPNIGLRGVNADRSAKVTLLEDGVPFAPAPYSAAAAYYFPLVTRMVAVEVFKGPASIRFGPQTVGGAINLVTRAVPEQAEGDLDLSVGNAGTWKGHGVVGYGTEHWGFLLEGVRWQSDGFKQLDGGGSTGFEKNELMLKGRLAGALSESVRQELELKLGLATEQSHETYLGLSPEDFAATPQRRYAASARDLMNWWRTQGALRWTLHAGEVFEFRAVAYRNDLRRDWFRLNAFREGPDLYELLASPAAGSRWRALLAGEVDSASAREDLMLVDNLRTFVSQGLLLSAVGRAATGPLRHEVEAGVHLHHDDIVRHHSLHGFVMQHATLVPDGAEGQVIADNVAFTRALAVHLTDTVTWGHLLVAPGARLEVMGLGSADHLDGSAGLNTQLVPLLGMGAVYSFEFGASVLAGVHQGFSPVAPGQSPDIKPETALNSELGVRFSRAGLRAEVIGFWSEYSNITGECTGSTGCVGDQVNLQFNGGKARVLGVEALASIKRRVGAGVSLGADVTYTFTSAHFLSDFTSENSIWGNVVAGDELPYVPQHEGQVRVRFAKGPVEAGVGAAFVGESRERAGQGVADASVRIPPRVSLDAQASIELGPARLYLTATNLTNQPALVARRPFGARPTAPLSFQVGFKYSFR